MLVVGFVATNALLPACSSDVPSASGAKTEWFLSCQASEQCPDLSECLCGICTAQCSDDDGDACVKGECSQQPDPSPCAQEASVGRICLPTHLLPFSPPIISAGLTLSGATSFDDPSFTEDRLELYFAVEGFEGGSQIWRSRRMATSLPWEAPMVVTELLPEVGAISMPGISSDGLTLYYVHVNENGRRFLQMTSRSSREAEWSTPERVAFSNETGRGESPSGTSDGLLLVWARKDAGFSQIHIARRADRSAPWDSAGAIEELSTPDLPGFEPWISNDGLTVFFRSNGDIYSTTRTSRDGLFAPPRAMEEINTESGEADPWISQDGRTIMFASDREGSWALYEAER